MPLQNRVTPSGDIVATPQSRPVHRQPRHHPRSRDQNADPALGRAQAWLTCVCEFRGRRREVMGGRSWTELFFLDEATALAAGHRPCFFCRRDDAKRFRTAWEAGNDVANVCAREIDAVLHRERLDRGAKRLHKLPMPVEELPDGAMVQQGEESFAILQGRALPWSLAGYRVAPERLHEALLLTPPSTLRALSAGYRPVLHPSAAAG